MVKVRIPLIEIIADQITAAQDQALRTNWIKANIDEVDCSPLCRVCHIVDESAMHIASGCELLDCHPCSLRVM